MISCPKKFSKYIPVVFLVFLACSFFYKFFLFKLISIPTDITVGMYYPWLDQRWSGLTTNVPVKNPLMSDLVSIIYQWRTIAIDNLKQGHFPFWTQSYLSGVPLFANFQNSLINFTNFPFFIIQNKGIAWTLMVLSQLIFSLISTYFCLRILKFKKLSSIIGSITYSFSLFNLVWLEYGIHTYVAAFLPIFIICIEKYFQKNDLKFLVLLSFLVALQFYGGYPQYSIFSLIFIFLYFIFNQPGKLIINSFKISWFIVLGLLLTAPLLIPGYELISRSIRSIDTTSQDQTAGFLPFQNFLTLPVPNFWGNPTTYDYFGSGFYDNNAVFPGTICLIAFIFVLITLLSHHLPKKIKFFLFTIIISFLISIKNPFSSFLKNNLGFIFSGNGVSTRIFLLGSFSFSVITAYFIDYIFKKPIIKFPIFFVVIWQSFILLFLKSQKIGSSQISLKNTVYSLVLSLVISLLVFFLTYKSFRKTLSLLLLISIVGELFYYGLKYLPFSNPEYLFPTTPSIEYLQKNSINYRVSTTNTIPANMWAPYGLNSSDGYDTTMPLINFEYYSLLQNQQFSSTAKRAITIDNDKSPLYQNLSIKYKLTLGNETATTKEKSKNQFFTVFGEKSTIIQENRSVLSKIRFVDQIKFVSNKNEFKDIYSNIDFSKTAILYSSDQNDFKNLDSTCVSKISNVKIISDEDDSIIFNTEDSCSRLVFISNSFYPGWEASIDGQKTKVYQTNHAFQSLLVPAGKHHVVLSYTPNHFRTSIIITLTSSIILLITLIYDVKRK
jgi:hypothetical protein